MNLRRLGSTAYHVSPIGMGLAALGRPGYINLGHAEDLENYQIDTMERHTHTMLSAAWDAGIRYFDAARSYGRAEAFLGSWLLETKPEGLIIGSKWGYTYTADWRVDAEVHEVKDHSVATLKKQWQETQAQLGQRPDLYQIHSATLATGVLDNKAVLVSLSELKAQGTAIGLSVSGSGQAQTIERALRLETNGTKLFDTVQATWNLLEPSAGKALQLAHHEGVGVIVKEALANGRLTRRNHEAIFAPKLGTLSQQAERLHTTPETLALAAVVRQPWVDTVLSGAATEAQLHDNLTALSVVWDYEVADALSEFAEPDYWNTRAALSWS